MSKKPTFAEAKQFASDLMLMKYRAMELGLFKTAHALEPGTRAVGWEIAEIMDNKHPTKWNRDDGTLSVPGSERTR
jgi:hypothetical protein